MPSQLFTPAELKIIVLGLVTVTEDIEACHMDQKYPFTPESRKDMKDMLQNAKSAKAKLESVINKGQAFHVAQYEEGDEKDFLTKES